MAPEIMNISPIIVWVVGLSQILTFGLTVWNLVTSASRVNARSIRAISLRASRCWIWVGPAPEPAPEAPADAAADDAAGGTAYPVVGGIAARRVRYSATPPGRSRTRPSPSSATCRSQTRSSR